MEFTNPHENITNIPLNKRGAFQRWRRIHLTPIDVRFWKKVQRNGPEECWPFIGNINNMGYGIFSPWADHRGRELAHRAAWRFANNQEIPEGLYICHRCDNPPCCNPNHLFAGTQRDNMSDASRKGRCNPAKGENTWSAKLTEQDVIRLRQMYAAGMGSYAELGRMFNLSKSGAGHIISRRKWKHI